MKSEVKDEVKSEVMSDVKLDRTSLGSEERMNKDEHGRPHGT